VLTANNLKSSLANQFDGKLAKFIQGSEIKQKSGLYEISNFFRANFVGVLAKPLTFQ
jgi:hypothetical protein